MKISTKAHYGLKVVIAIADIGKPDEPVSVTDIAHSEGLTEAYVEQIVGKLRQAGILCSYRGAKGGYMLKRSPDEISVADVMEASGEQITFPECTTPVGCIFDRQSKHACASSHFWQRLNDMMLKAAEETTVGQLMRDVGIEPSFKPAKKRF